MTDDSINSILTHPIQRGFALASLEDMPGGEGVPQIVDNIPSTSSPNTDPFPDSITQHTTTHCRAFTTFLDLTDGAWNTLPISNSSTLTGTITNVTNIYDVPFDKIMSIKPANINNLNPVQYSQPLTMLYSWFKFRNIHIKLKNFMVIIERDTSGGIQALDEPIFEIRRTYSRVTSNGTDALSLPPIGGIRFTKTELQNGYSINLPFTQFGWLNGAQLFTGTGVYHTFGSLAISTTPAQFTRWYPESPNFITQIRLINFPALTNVRLGINYVWELNANITSLVGDQSVDRVLPYVGGATPVLMDNNENEIKKRKLYLMCFYSEFINLK